MATTIKLKNGTGVPLVGDLVQGEPAFDLTNKRLYTENASGAVIEVGTNPSTLSVAGAATFGGAVDIGGVISINGDATVDNDSVSSYWKATSGNHYFQIGGATKMTLDANGNLGIGTSLPDYKLQIDSGATSASAFFSTSEATAYTATAYNGGGARLSLSGANASGATTGINLSHGGLVELYFGAVQEAGGAGAYVWQGYSGTAYNERMRLDASGNLLVGATDASLTGVASKLLVSAASGSVFGSINSELIVDGQQTGIIIRGEASGAARTGSIAVYKHAGITNAAAYLTLTPQDGSTNYYWTDDSDIFRISTNSEHVGTTSGTVVGTQTSDERLKDIEPSFEYGLTHIMQLQPIAYTLKDANADQSRKLGFGAQTTQAIVPESVYDTNECLHGYDTNPDDPMDQTPCSHETKLAMEYVQIVPVLVKAMQEQQAIIDALTARIEALEGA
jgi:hypothetical protein